MSFAQNVVVSRPIFRCRLRIAIFQRRRVARRAHFKLRAGRQSIHNRPDQKQSLHQFRMRQHKIDRNSRACGTCRQYRSLNFPIADHRQQIFHWRILRLRGVGLPIAATVISNRVILRAERPPLVFPCHRMQPRIVQQNHGRRPRPAFFVVNFRTACHFDSPAHRLLYAFQFLRRLLDRNPIDLHRLFLRRRRPRILPARRANAHDDQRSAQ